MSKKTIIKQYTRANNNEMRMVRPRPNGFYLGDMVEQIAKPIARGIDWVFGTDLEHCGGCTKRKNYLNNLTAPKKSQNDDNKTEV